MEAAKSHVICGTAEYMSPEMLRGQGSGLATDWWSFGCLIYEMLTGAPPFLHPTKDKLYKLIKYAPPRLDHSYLSPEAVDICSKLLEKDPTKRLGSQGAEEIIKHPWFAPVAWDPLRQKKAASPYTPQLDSQNDVKYFSSEFTEMKLSPDCDQNSQLDQIQPKSSFGILNDPILDNDDFHLVQQEQKENLNFKNHQNS